MGAGALGLLFGSYFKLAFQTSEDLLIYITRTKAQATELNHQGWELLDIEGHSSHFQSGIKGVSISELEAINEADKHHPLLAKQNNQNQLLAESDLVLVTVKHPQLEAVLTWIKETIPIKAPIILLMNGLEQIEKGSDICPQHALYFGMTTCGATKKGSRQVMEKGRNITSTGSLTGNQNHHVSLFASRLTKAGFPFTYTDQIESLLWRKCLINACINPLTALLRVQNGSLISNQWQFKMLNQLCDEAELLIDKLTIKVFEQRTELRQEIINVCRNTSTNQSSMLQDVLLGQTTEIEAITGFILVKAKQLNVQMPSHSFLYAAIKALETTSRGG